MDTDTAALLHNSCMLYPDTVAVVESALQMDPEAIRRPIPISCGGDETRGSLGASSSFLSPTGGAKRRIFQQYSYPINIALKCNATVEVLELLIKQGPDVLDKPDGPTSASALGIAIALERDKRVVELIVEANPSAARTTDRYSNTALHALVRCRPLATFDTVRLVYQAYPEALMARNFHRETPLDVAVRSEAAPEDVINFFHSRAFGGLEAEAESHLENLHHPDDLDDVE